MAKKKTENKNVQNNQNKEETELKNQNKTKKVKKSKNEKSKNTEVKETKNGKNKNTEVKETKKSKKIKEQKVSKKDNSASKEAKEQIENRFSSNGEFAKLIKIVLIVTAIMLVFYLITLVATNKADEAKSDNKTDDKVAATEIQYDYIMIGTMLSRDGEFYVLIEGVEDNRLSEYTTLIETAKANEDAPTIYKAKLTDAFNKGYLSKEAKYDVSDIKDFRVTGTTLVKIADGSIKETYDSYEAIKNKLTELSK